jgi:hypothetical protein
MNEAMHAMAAHDAKDAFPVECAFSSGDDRRVPVFCGWRAGAGGNKNEFAREGFGHRPRGWADGSIAARGTLGSTARKEKGRVLLASAP